MPEFSLYTTKSMLCDTEVFLLWKLELHKKSQRKSYFLKSPLQRNYFFEITFFQVVVNTYLIFSHHLISNNYNLFVNNTDSKVPVNIYFWAWHMYHRSSSQFSFFNSELHNHNNVYTVHKLLKICILNLN